ncbi:C4-dicarboxylate ABC transporter substrate-binding protein [Paracoccus salsus]|uniref:C4-dicarboxylate ABC transporter substrate-binding protein n=1 Tax=Paracoccus salsus TaxID=2911061 RepID=UPI001F45C941|nr:C4-dicarboxylate ABC transporter substrate-binding protein [Paracoccus salsus]MCF3973408.1 C4-dicarboxylate ABC transporter substrate-binding protein [Paracoccus salsus]
MSSNRSFRTSCIAAGLSVTTMLPALGQATPIHGEPGPNRGARAEVTQWFADGVPELTGRDLTPDINCGGALVSEQAAVWSPHLGAADPGSVIAVWLPQETISDGIADLPPENPDAWAGMKATDALIRNNDQARANLAAQNPVCVATHATAAMQPGFKGPERGLVDLAQTGSGLVKALKSDEAFDSYTFIDGGQLGGMGILMNRSVFDGLPPDQQQAILAAGAGLADAFGRVIGAASSASIRIRDDQGKEIVTLPGETRAKLVRAAQRHADDRVERANASGLDGQAILDDYRGLTRHHDDELAEQGCPWKRG